MRKIFLAILFVGLPVLVASCSSDSGGSKGASSGGTTASTSTSQGGSSAKESSSAVGGSSAQAGSSATGGRTSGTAGTGGSSGGSTAMAGSGGATSTGGSSKADSGGGTGGAATAGAGGASKSAGGSGTVGGSGTAGNGGGGTTSSGGGTTSSGTQSSKSDPVQSQGCGNADGPKTVTAGGQSVAKGLPTSTKLKITSGGKDRDYIIDIPADYDPKHAYRLFFAFHWIGSKDLDMATGQQPAVGSGNFDAEHYAYYGLRRKATEAKDPAIFIAPSAEGGQWDAQKDGALFDDLLALASKNLCIDTSRVFATGFSFGAMMSYAMSITRQKQLRAVVTMAPANFNLPNEPTDSNAGPIAYMGTTGMDDGVCAYCCVSGDPECKQCGIMTPGVTPETAGGKICALTHAKDNGCKIPTTIPTAAKGSKKYVCYDFEGCKEGYPVKLCTFDGVHQPAPVSDGITTLDDGLKSWVPDLAWTFLTQF